MVSFVDHLHQANSSAHNPEMIDLLFRCVRPPWNLKLTQSPHTIPGVVVQVEDNIQTMADT